LKGDDSKADYDDNDKLVLIFSKVVLVVLGDIPGLVHVTYHMAQQDVGADGVGARLELSRDIPN